MSSSFIILQSSHTNRRVTPHIFCFGDSSVKNARHAQKSCNISCRIRILQEISFGCLFLHSIHYNLKIVTITPRFRRQKKKFQKNLVHLSGVRLVYISGVIHSRSTLYKMHADMSTNPAMATRVHARHARRTRYIINTNAACSAYYTCVYIRFSFSSRASIITHRVEARFHVSCLRQGACKRYNNVAGYNVIHHKK